MVSLPGRSTSTRLVAPKPGPISRASSPRSIPLSPHGRSSFLTLRAHQPEEQRTLWTRFTVRNRITSVTSTYQVTCSVMFPKLPPPQRAPTWYAPGARELGMRVVAAKLPLGRTRMKIALTPANSPPEWNAFEITVTLPLCEQPLLTLP